MNQDSIEKIITTISKFIFLTNEEADLIRNNLVILKVKANEIIHSEGTICNFEAFIETGLLRTYYVINGNERIIHFFKENEWISDFKSFILQEPSKITIQAIEDCELVLIRKTHIHLFSKNISNWDTLGKLFFKKLFIQNFNHIESLLTNTPEERYIYLLENNSDLINRIPQYLIAQYIGVQPESLSRIRKRISKSLIS